jgi:hypothetical protein
MREAALLSIVLALAVPLPPQAPPPPTQPMPGDLTMLLGRARIRGMVQAWCRGEFGPGQTGYAVALASPDAGNRYVAIAPDGKGRELAPFAGAPELSCYSPQEVRALSRSLRESPTIEGSIVPRWNATTVCGFVDAVRAVCWQFSPAQEAFVKVGEWTT